MTLPPDRAAWPEPTRELFEERAAILEFEAELPRREAEFHADVEVRKRAARRGAQSALAFGGPARA